MNWYPGLKKVVNACPPYLEDEAKQFWASLGQPGLQREFLAYQLLTGNYKVFLRVRALADASFWVCLIHGYRVCVCLFPSPFPSLTCLSVFPKVGEGMSPRPEMTLSSLRQYPEGVFYDLDSCKPFSYPDSDGGLGE